MTPAARFAKSLIAGALLCGAGLIAVSPAVAAADSLPEKQSAAVSVRASTFGQLNRLTWGAGAASVETVAAVGLDAWLSEQLRSPAARLPAAAQAQIDAMTITREPVETLVREMERQRKAANDITDDEQKQAARKAYQREMTRLEREAATRHVLRALYSPNQLQEQMTWFWMNHFSVHARKGDIRAMVGDYEEAAVRPHALGKFRDLLGAVAHHPAMLRYLDNAANAKDRINENYARELMELHTLGVDAGYSQTDVQELARVLTGVGIDRDGAEPRLPRNLQPYYVHRGLFEFNPRRHDFEAKQFLGEPIRSGGLAETDEALDRLARHPATAHFVSRKLAAWWVSDDPPKALVERMAQTFGRTDGDIAQVLHTLFASAEFQKAAGAKFKDPMRYAMSALRLTFGDQVILNVDPVLNWLNRMGEPLYGRQTPDGYPLDGASWTSPGQMATRFEIAKAVGSGRAPLFEADGAPTQDRRAAVPRIDEALFRAAIAPTLGAATRAALDKAASPAEWNTFLLASPEFMKR